MPPKHTIDLDNQGSLLPPTTASEDVDITTPGSAMEAIDGVYFPQQAAGAAIVKTEAVLLSPEVVEEVQSLEYEHKALDALALESRARGNVTRADNTANRISDGLEDETEDKTLEDLKESADGSLEAIEGLVLSSKGNLARSKGIAARTREVYKTDENGQVIVDEKTKKPVFDKLDIVTDNPEEQAMLDALYRKFRLEYYGARRHHALLNRRNAIKTQIRNLQAAE